MKTEMKVTGFTIARNVVKYGYPILESIQSILPICDEFLILLGKSEDDSLDYLRSLDDPKIKIVETVWNETLQDGGKVLAVETDKAFQMIGQETDWCFYIQADEVVHEKYLDTIRGSMQLYRDDPTVQGLLFKYLHFYHSFDYIAKASKFYKHEIRVIKNNKKINAYRDAQGFRINNNEKINVKKIDAFIYHYGWVRPPAKMLTKQSNIMKYYHSQSFIQQKTKDLKEFWYNEQKYHLDRFRGTHPKVMQQIVSEMDWDFDINDYRTSPKLKERLKGILRKYLSINLEYANYKVV